MQEVRARPKASVLQPLGKKLRAMIALKKGEFDAMLPGQTEAFRRSPLFRDHYHNIDPSVSARSDSSDEQAEKPTGPEEDSRSIQGSKHKARRNSSTMTTMPPSPAKAEGAKALRLKM